MSTPIKGRAPRPRTSHFDATALVNAWAPMARLRRGIQWDGSGYSALGRTLVPAPASLERHVEPLEKLVELAPTGFPSHPVLRQALAQLHEKFGILGDMRPDQMLKISSQAANHWRIMCRHLYELKKKGGCTGFDAVNKVIDKVQLPSEEVHGEDDHGNSASQAQAQETDSADAAAGPPTPPKPLSAQDVQSLFPAMDQSDIEGLHEPASVDSSDDVELTDAVCWCPACMAASAASLNSADASPLLHSTGSIPIPCPTRGGQKRETLQKLTGTNSKPKYRIMVKTRQAQLETLVQKKPKKIKGNAKRTRTKARQ